MDYCFVLFWFGSVRFALVCCTWIQFTWRASNRTINHVHCALCIVHAVRCCIRGNISLQSIRYMEIKTFVFFCSHFGFVAYLFVYFAGVVVVAFCSVQFVFFVCPVFVLTTFQRTHTHTQRPIIALPEFDVLWILKVFQWVSDFWALNTNTPMENFSLPPQNIVARTLRVCLRAHLCFWPNDDECDSFTNLYENRKQSEFLFSGTEK